MSLFKKKTDVIDDYYKLKDNIGDPFLDGKIPLRRLSVEIEQEEPISLIDLIERQKEVENG